MFHSAFHLYFGALDILLYAAAFLVSLSVSRGICDDIDAAASQPVSVTSTDVATHENAKASSNASSQLLARSVSAKSSSDKPLISNENNEIIVTDDDNPVLRLSDVHIYKLHKKSVILIDDIPFDVPERIRRYMLRKRQVVRLKDLETFAKVFT